jgi:hypothetical protein
LEISVAAAGKKSHGVERAVEQKRAAKSPHYFSRAVGKALEVLELLRSSSEPLSLNDISKRVRLVKSSLFRITHTGRQPAVCAPFCESRH